MPTRKAHQNRKPNSDEQLAEMEKQAMASPGVIDMMLVYEAAEKAYSTTISSTVEEPRIWFSTSTH